jgi:hypothetical protein
MAHRLYESRRPEPAAKLSANCERGFAAQNDIYLRNNTTFETAAAPLLVPLEPLQANSLRWRIKKNP